jgi:hypothetical protein
VPLVGAAPLVGAVPLKDLAAIPGRLVTVLIGVVPLVGAAPSFVPTRSQSMVLAVVWVLFASVVPTFSPILSGVVPALGSLFEGRMLKNSTYWIWADTYCKH